MGESLALFPHLASAKPLSTSPDSVGLLFITIFCLFLTACGGASKSSTGSIRYHNKGFCLLFSLYDKTPLCFVEMSKHYMVEGRRYVLCLFTARGISRRLFPHRYKATQVSYIPHPRYHKPKLVYLCDRCFLFILQKYRHMCYQRPIQEEGCFVFVYFQMKSGRDDTRALIGLWLMTA